MRIKDRMEVGQTWKDYFKDEFRITGMGEDSFFSKMADGEGWCPERAWTYGGAENWTLTHDSDGNPVCEFCDPNWDVCWNPHSMAPASPGSANFYCTRKEGHGGDHSVCVSMPAGEVDHYVHRWPQEEEDNPTCPEQSRRAGVVKKDVLTFDQPLDRVDTTCLGSAIDHKNYIGWEDEEGDLHGAFRHYTGGHSTRLTKEEWDTGCWSVVRPVKLWFEGEGDES